MQTDASSVLSIALVSKKTLSEESLEDSRDRARVQMDDAREFSSRETRTLGYDPKDQPLRTSDSKRRLHVFRCALEPVLDVPQQTHEVQNWVQVELSRGFGRLCGATVGHGISLPPLNLLL
jgi:hypothetical protein